MNKFDNLYNLIMESLDPFIIYDGLSLAIIPGSFKPPHKGHCEMIQFYKNFVDKVVVIISNPVSKESQRITNLGNQITADMSKEIFNIYKKNNNWDNVEIIISKSPSPVTDGYHIVDKLCANSKIYFGSSTKGDDHKSRRWSGMIERMKNNDKNNTIMNPKLYPFDSKSNISSTDIRMNINKLNRSWFPDNISDRDFKHIQQILVQNV